MFPETLRWLRTKCSRLFRRGKAEEALDAELRFHLDQLIAQFRGEGMTAQQHINCGWHDGLPRWRGAHRLLASGPARGAHHSNRRASSGIDSVMTSR